MSNHTECDGYVSEDTRTVCRGRGVGGPGLQDEAVFLCEKVLLGGYSSEVPPLPIPNREVKLTNADGTAYLGGRVGSRLFKVRQ